MTGLEPTERDQRVEGALAELARGYEPPPNWEARVWARALRQQTASPRPRPAWLRQLVPALALAALIAVSAVLGGALWRARSELGAMQDEVEQEQRAVEQLRRDLIEARLEARSARAEKDQLEALAALSAECPATDDHEQYAATLAKKQRELEKVRRKYKERERRVRKNAAMACDPVDPLCGL